MTRRLVPALIALALLPAAALAVPRTREARVHPRDAAAVPSYVRRVEPAISHSEMPDRERASHQW